MSDTKSTVNGLRPPMRDSEISIENASLCQHIFFLEKSLARKVFECEEAQAKHRGLLNRIDNDVKQLNEMHDRAMRAERERDELTKQLNEYRNPHL